LNIAGLQGAGTMLAFSCGVVTNGMQSYICTDVVQKHKPFLFTCGCKGVFSD